MQSYENNGNAYSGTLGISATYRPINSLQFELRGGYQPHKLTGEINRTINPINAMLIATYNIRQFYVSALGFLGGRTLNSFGMVQHEKAAYSFRGGWGNGNWNIQLQANNIFNSSWYSNKTDILYPLYSSFRTNNSGMYHRNMVIRVSYTFDYGKRIKYTDEIGANETNSSAVLK